MRVIVPRSDGSVRPVIVRDLRDAYGSALVARPARGVIGDVAISKSEVVSKLARVDAKIESLRASVDLWARARSGGKAVDLKLPTGDSVLIPSFSDKADEEFYLAFRQWVVEWKTFKQSTEDRWIVNPSLGMDWPVLYHDAEKYELQADEWAAKLRARGGSSAMPKTVTDKDLDETKPSVFSGLNKIPWTPIVLIAGAGVAVYALSRLSPDSVRLPSWAGGKGGGGGSKPAGSSASPAKLSPTSRKRLTAA